MPQDSPLLFLLTACLLPPGFSVVLLFLALLSRGSVRGWLLLLGFVSLYVSSIPLGADWLRGRLETDPPVALEHSAAEAIVVLGADRRSEAPEYGGGDTLYRLGLERVRYAAWLAKKTGLPVLASGGSVQEGKIAEAELMREILKEFGVEARWLEDKSRNTYENAVFSSQLLKGVGIGEILLVTHGWHMPRAAEAFEKAGMRVIRAPTGMAGPDKGKDFADWVPDATSLQMSHWALHELLGRLWYHSHYYGSFGMAPPQSDAIP